MILLSFTNGLDAIQKNAYVAIACIRSAMSQTKAPLVVGGVSMGGLITRFALAALESRDLPAQTRLYVSIDTPHGGGVHERRRPMGGLLLRACVGRGRGAFRDARSTSNQQFMMVWLNGTNAIESPLRTEFMRELNGVGGYPQRPRRIAMSCGRGDGVRSIPPATPLLTWAGGPFAALQVTSLSEGGDAAVIAHGYSFLADSNTPPELSIASPISWEGAPGGLNFYNAIADDIVEGIGFGPLLDPIPVTCSVPTLSALDIDPKRFSPFAPVPDPHSGASPFHEYICSAENTPHLTITPEVSTWLLERLGAPSEKVVEPSTTTPAITVHPRRRSIPARSIRTTRHTSPIPMRSTRSFVSMLRCSGSSRTTATGFSDTKTPCGCSTIPITSDRRPGLRLPQMSTSS